MSDPDFFEQLAQFRQQINQLTDELYEVLDRRTGVVSNVGRLKSKTLNAQNPAEFYRVDREALMLADMAQREFDHIPSLKAAQLLKEIISVSLSIESTQRIAYVMSVQDISSVGVVDRFGHCAHLTPCPDLPTAIKYLLDNDCDHGVFPASSVVVKELLDHPTLYLNGRIEYPAIDDSETVNQYLVLSRCEAIKTHDEHLDRHLSLLNLNTPVDSSAEDLQTAIAEWFPETIAGSTITPLYPEGLRDKTSQWLLDVPLSSASKLAACYSIAANQQTISLSRESLGHYDFFDTSLNISASSSPIPPKPIDH